MKLWVRLGLAAALAVTAFSHAYLYVHGYQHIPMIGTAFLVQASVSLSLALLVAAGGPRWVDWSAAAVAGGSLVAFVLSRTVGLFGFTERGWEPAPHAALTVVAEALCVALWAAAFVRWPRASAAGLRTKASAAAP
ncbi:hypothetical protein AWC11_24430 [Mycobacterium interjectum]|jgi:hypothetical protein|nr:hypothetical protein AWC11_24430 [Mycobacterium interjectum]